MPENPQDLSFDSLAFAVEKNAVEQFRAWARWPGLEFRVDSDRIWTIAGVRSPIFNNIVRATFDPAAVEESIDRALLPYRERNVQAYWWVGRSSRPADLGSHLTAHGLKTAFIAPAMAADLQALPEHIPAPAGLAVEEVVDVSAFRKWLKFTAAAMDLPSAVVKPWTEMHGSIGFGPSSSLRRHLAFLGGEPVASASLFNGPVLAGVESLITGKEYRRKGIGSALTVTILRAARTSGYRVGALLSTLEAAGMYRRLGFREYGRQWCYLWESGGAA
jgi:GNAT superfamily N-acetyltransferase